MRFIGVFEREEYQRSVKKVWLIGAVYTIVFQLMATLAVLVEVFYDPKLMHGDKIDQIGSPYFVAVAAGLFVIFVATSPRLRKTFFQTGRSRMTWQKFVSLVALMLLIQLIFTVYSNGLESLLNQLGFTANAELKSASAGSEAWSMFLYSGFLAPITEEIVFRGFVLRSVQPYGISAAILLSAGLFGLYHLNIMQSPFAFGIGLILAVVALKFGIKWSIALHSFNNSVLGDVFGRILDALPKQASSVLNVIIFVGGGLVGAWILWQKRQRIKSWYARHRLRRHELKLVFGNWLGIVITVLSIIMMVANLSHK